jgi:hypothetical protein
MTSVRLSLNLRIVFCITLVLAEVLPARAQSFVFTKIVDTNDPVPNGAGALFATLDFQPAFNGGTTVFRNGPGSLSPDSIWSATSDGTLTKLVDLNTTVPGGTGKFSALISRFLCAGFSGVELGYSDFRRPRFSLERLHRRNLFGASGRWHDHPHCKIVTWRCPAGGREF